MALKDFIPNDKQHLITEAIVRAEKMTSGEIVVHVTPRCKGDVMEAAKKTFNDKKLYQTRHRNAVLVFIAYKSRKLAVIGDAGIYELAPDNIWDVDVALLREKISGGLVAEAIVECVERIGERLATFFPAEKDDVNELSNDISYSE